MISVAEARKKITDAMPAMPAERIALPTALGRALAEDLTARRTQPPKAVSAMDGYAVRSQDVTTIPTTLKIIGHVPAGQSYDGTIGPGETVRIFTGAPLPDGADAIVIQENTEAAEGTVDIIDGAAPKGRFVRPAGLDFSEGDTLLEKGSIMTARAIGLVAGMNIPWVSVSRKPRIALLATGDEIVMPGEPIADNQIVSSNGLALAGFIQAMGGEPVDLGIAPDCEDALRTMAEGARGADMLVTCGGASVGDHDLVQKVLGDIGLEIDFWRIAMRPGKPLMFGHIGDTRMLGLPGNPVSAQVCATIFLGPAIAAMLGVKGDGANLRAAMLGGDIGENDEREDYLRASLTSDDDGNLITNAFSKQDSSVFSGFARADCLIVRAPHAPVACRGDRVSILMLGGGIIST